MQHSDSTHNEWMIHRKLSEHKHLTHERRALASLLAPDEELLDVVSATRGFGKPGILAITDRRLIYVVFGMFTRYLKVRSMDYSEITGVELASSWRSKPIPDLIVHRRQNRDLTISLMDDDVGKAAEVSTCIGRALGRHDFRVHRA